MKSMTAFARGGGTFGRYDWSLEIRSVNGKALDARVKAPDFLQAIDVDMKKLVVGAISRGNVQINLRVSQSESHDETCLDHDKLRMRFHAAADVEKLAREQGITIAPLDMASLLSDKTLTRSLETETDIQHLRSFILTEFSKIQQDFLNMRMTEGAALQQILQRQLSDIQDLVDAAKTLIPLRAQGQKDILKQAMERLDQVEIDTDRLAQELALIAIKSDVSEEIDRLSAHIDHGHKLLMASQPVGRKFDFLMQEFNREANTLCAKSGSSELTKVGMDLKVIIDQMREQIQNVE